MTTEATSSPVGLLTISELAARVRRPVATVRYWRAMGQGPRGANVAGRVLYRETDVEAWIDAQFNDPKTAA